MEPALLSLIAASLTLVGTHFALSHPLRTAIVGVAGERGFQGIYSVISLAAIVWMYFAYVGIENPDVLWAGGYTDPSWIAGSIIALFAVVLLAGSMTPRNPAMAMPGAAEAARAQPQGVFRITRHPMMWGFALWGVSHIIAAPTERGVTVAVAIIVLALVGAHLQDGKKRAVMGDDWAAWESQTSYWPRLSGIASIGLSTWIIGIVLWLGFTWLHLPLADIAAGIWRWI